LEINDSAVTPQIVTSRFEQTLAAAGRADTRPGHGIGDDRDAMPESL
jgi:hypothetical protein